MSPIFLRMALTAFALAALTKYEAGLVPAPWRVLARVYGALPYILTVLGVAMLIVGHIMRKEYRE